MKLSNKSKGFKGFGMFDEASYYIGEGLHTLNGLRTNIRVGIAYMHGWNKDIGCVSFDNLMEDLATLEISRAQVWQWLHHNIILDEGMRVDAELIQNLFNEETERIITEFGEEERLNLIKASEDARKIFLQKDLPDFLTCASGPV